VTTVLLAALGLYLALGATLYLLQRSFLFPRTAERADPALAGIPGLEEITLATEDGERLVAWHVPPAEGRPVLLYLHGNAGNLATPERRERLRQLSLQGLGLIAVSYRGYGGSTGHPSEAGLIADARAGHAEATRRYGPERLVLYGESLGTGVATRLALERPAAALVLESPYRSIPAVVSRLFFFLPVERLMWDTFRTEDVIAGVTMPILILHGDRDRVIPLSHGLALEETARAPRRMIVYRGGGHDDLHTYGAAGDVAAFLEDAAAGRLDGAERIERGN